MSNYNKLSLEDLLDEYYYARCELDEFFREVPYWNEYEETRDIATTLANNCSEIFVEIERRTFHEVN